MPVQLTYGSRIMEFEAPGEVRTLRPPLAASAASQSSLVRAALEQPIDSPPLAQLARGRRSAIILIACRTRRTGSQVFLPEIVRTLNAAGIADENILVYAATGTHDNWRPEDAPLLAGADCAGRLRFVGHNCRDNLEFVGTTSRGNRVALSRDYLDADLKIATGRVTHHYFAGFTGGRKAILPGVAGFDTIVFNHRMVTRMTPRVELEPEARNGNLATNPIHLDMLEAAHLAPPDFTLNTVLDPHNEIVAVHGGDFEASHAVAVDEVSRRDCLVLEQPADWMFLSCGGAHCDVNAVQMLKAVINNYKSVRRGGAIILAAECAEGMAPWLRQLCTESDRHDLARRIAGGELRHPHNALFLQQVTDHAHVIMISKLAPEEAAALGFHKAADLDEAMALATRLAGKPRQTVIVPFGNTTVARVRDDHSTAVGTLEVSA